MKPQPISDHKREANRRNAQHSTGPKSAEGKKTVSHNALRHGLTGQVVILTHEDREAHDKFCNALIDCLRPDNAIESQIAHSIAEDHWRINRLRATENNILAKASAGAQSEIEAALDTADAFLREAKQLQLLSLYEQRINRSIIKNMDQIRQVQTERKAQEKEQMEQAMLLAQLSLSKGIPYDPAADFPANTQAARPELGVRGFVFSTTEINRNIDRNNRLNEARQLNSAISPNPNRAPRTKIHPIAIAA